MLGVIEQQRCLVASVSSFLIMLVLRPLLENAVSASRSICSLWWTVVRLLARDDDTALVDGSDDSGISSGSMDPGPRRRHYNCERCARRGTPSTFSDDVAAVVASLGLVADDDDSNGAEDDGCGGCAATAAVEELTESKVAGEAELREAFYVFDRDEDGFVTPAELWNVMRRLGAPEGARYDDCRRMIAAHDRDGDGRVSFHEFRAMMENAA